MSHHHLTPIESLALGFFVTKALDESARDWEQTKARIYQEDREERAEIARVRREEASERAESIRMLERDLHDLRMYESSMHGVEEGYGYGPETCWHLSHTEKLERLAQIRSEIKQYEGWIKEAREEPTRRAEQAAAEIAAEAAAQAAKAAAEASYRSGLLWSCLTFLALVIGAGIFGGH